MKATWNGHGRVAGRIDAIQDNADPRSIRNAGTGRTDLNARPCAHLLTAYSDDDPERFADPTFNRTGWS